MEKKLFIGTTKPSTYDRRPLPITLRIELEEKEGMEHFKTTSLTPITPPALCLSISGDIGNQQGGQIEGTLRQFILDDLIVYRPGWNAEKLTRLLDIWKQWHMNDMKSGCIHQSTAETRKEITLINVKVHVWKIKDEATRRRMERTLELYNKNRTINLSELFPLDYLVLDCMKAARKGEVYQAKTPGEQSYFDHQVIEIKTEKKAAGWVYPKDHPEGMLTKPCPQCGYKYGSEWLFDALPPEVISFINTIDQGTPEELEEADAGNVKGFVKRHKITIDGQKVTENPNAPDWKDANHYKTTLIYQGKKASIYFSQGFGIEHPPTAADVLNCLALDAQTLLNYPDPLEWAEALGMETGKKTAKAFKHTQKNSEALERLLGPVLMHELLEETETL